jgi:hypothetical protein
MWYVAVYNADIISAARFTLIALYIAYGKQLIDKLY